jgi:hypothetical protein
MGVIGSTSEFRRLGLGKLFALVWVVAVVLVSVAAHGRASWIRALAASPDRIREGKLWLLVSSAGLVDHPLVLSLVSFVALAGLALVVCGPRVFWCSAFFGQVLATLLVYVLFIGAVRWVVPGVFGSVVSAPDYGVSTISAAWLGSIATVAWRRRDRSRAGKLSIALSCVAVGLFAYSVRPDLTVLSSEHLVAFALGTGSAIPGWWSRTFAATWRWPAATTRVLFSAVRVGKLDPIATAAVMIAVLVLAIAEVPTALATFREEIAVHLDPTVSRCAANWNVQGEAPRLFVERRQINRVSIRTFRSVLSRETAAKREPAKWADYCRYKFSGPSRSIVFLGLWRRGRVDHWSKALNAPSDRSVDENATLQRNGRVHLLHAGATHSSIVLSS